MRHAKETMKSEMDMMEMKINNFKLKYQAIDLAMYSEIETSPHNDQTKEMWMKDCKLEEENSESIWKEKEEWFSTIEFDPEATDNNENRQPTRENPEQTTRNTNFTNGQRQNNTRNSFFRRPTYIPEHINNRIRNQYRQYRNKNTNQQWQRNGNPENGRNLQRSNSFLSQGRSQVPDF